MDFGLGLILSFTDNATAGIQNAVNSLGQLTETAQSASSQLNNMALMTASQMAIQLGNSLQGAGSKILSTFGQVIGKVNETGQTLQSATLAFDTLYKDSGKSGKQVVSDIQNYAAHSIFAFEDLLPVVQMLKANGIEAFDAISTSSGKATQTLMGYASDLAAFNPQMRNAYGTGVQAAMGAINEYIAEGNKKSLKSGASIDIEQILGESKGSTIEERSQQIADLLEKLNMVGMTANLAGTPMQQLSNMEDQVFIMLGKIANSGVYDMISEMLGMLSSTLEKLPLDSIAQSIGQALTTIMQPIKSLEEAILPLIERFGQFLAQNPKFAQFVIIATAVAGALLVLSGVALKVFGTIGMLVGGLNTLTTTFGAVGGALKLGVTKILGALVPLTLAIGLLAVVWKNDLFGIRTAVTGFVQNVVSAFQTAKSAVGGSLGNLQTTLSGFDTSHSFFDGLTLGIMRVMTLGKALAEGWNDYTLSEDTYLKAKELGILPLIEAIFDLKYRFDNFKAGFIQGWRDISDRVKNFIAGLKLSLSGTIFDDMLTGVTNFFQALSNNDAQAWYDFGYSFAEFTAKAIAFTVAMKAIMKVVSVVSSVAKVVSKVFNGLVKVVQFAIGLPAKISGAFSAITGFIGKAVSDVIGFFQLVKTYGLSATLKGLFGTAQTIAAGIVSIIAGMVLAVTNFVSQWKNGFNVVKAILMTLGIALVAVGAIIIGAPALIAGIVAGIVAIVANLAIVIHDHWEQIKAWFASVANWFNSNVIQPLVQFFQPAIDLIKNMWESFMQTVQNVKDRILEFWQAIVTGVQSWIANVMSYIQPMVDNFNQLKATFFEFCQFIGQKLSALWTGTIMPVLSAIGSFFQSVFTAIFNIVSTVWNAIWNVISPIVMAIWNTINSVFTAIFNTIMNVLTAIWNGIVGIVNGIITFVMGILSNVWAFISNVLMGIMNLIMGHTEQAKQNFMNAWNAILGIITSVLSGIWQVISSVFTTIASVIMSVLQGIWNVVTSIWNGILSTISAVLSGISSVVSSVWNAISSTVSSIMTGIQSRLSSAWNTVKSTVSSVVNGVKSAVSSAFNSMSSTVSSIAGSIQSTVTSKFNAVKTGISNAINGAKSVVQNGLNAIKGFFSGLSLKLPHIALPHFSISGSLSITPPSVPHLSVSWYKTGGVFNQPSVIGVGEAGAEAVMPLENNTGWIGVLANSLATEMSGQASRLRPQSTTTYDNTTNTNRGQYMTNNNNSTTYEGNTDNSVVFNQGAIQIVANNSSTEEARRLAEEIMAIIKRQKELDDMTSYGFA